MCQDLMTSLQVIPVFGATLLSIRSTSPRSRDTKSNALKNFLRIDTNTKPQTPSLSEPSSSERISIDANHVLSSLHYTNRTAKFFASMSCGAPGWIAFARSSKFGLHYLTCASNLTFTQSQYLHLPSQAPLQHIPIHQGNRTTTVRRWLRTGSMIRLL